MYSLSKITTISLVAGCAFVLTTARAVDPPPDGGYPNGNTAEGQDALPRLVLAKDIPASGGGTGTSVVGSQWSR